ncbi:hypothetical protein [Methanobrevibacter arboriphilus]|uniref:hypothetical protein n=1 Tax=Methanobrevibacter arboriphilus TaxID=39441 RepID=UPI0005B284CA|nr:hypothetical protein [Methanobrevibacter arboriphilus]
MDNENCLHNDLISDLNYFKTNELNDFKKINPFSNNSFIKNKVDNWELLDLFSKKINYEISKERIYSLINSNKPYGSKDFKELDIDKNQLVSINDFEVNRGGYFTIEGFIYKNNLYSLCLPHNAFHSYQWIHQNLVNSMDNEEINIRIRLDPLAKNFLTSVNKMVIYGENLNWDDLANLTEEKHYKFLNDSNGEITDLVWKPDGNELHLTCEELPNIEFSEIKGARYLHAIYNKDLETVTHCDGSLRIYTKNELMQRKNYHVRHSNSRKMGKRVKIFQVNGYIPTKDFTSFVNSFYLWNDDINNYFTNLNSEKLK